MTLYGIDYTERMRPIVAAGARYKVAVIRSQGTLEEKALNVGKELSRVIDGIGKQYGKMGETKFQMEVVDALNRIVRGKVFVDEELGEVVVLENLGLLFEPGLATAVARFLRHVPKTTLTVSLRPGEIGTPSLSFLDRESEITLKQTDINYITI